MTDGDASVRARTELEQLFAGGREMVVHPEGNIITPGAEPGHVYLIRAGRVRIGRSSPDGRELTLAIIGPGEILGEIALLDGGERTASAVAHTEVRLAALSRSQFLEAIAAQPENALRLIVALCRRIRQADLMVEELTFLGVKERLANLIDRFAAKGDEALLSILTHQEIAEMIGTSRESVTRALNELRRDREEDGKKPSSRVVQ